MSGNEPLTRMSRTLAAVAALAVAASSCSVKTMAVKTVANTLAESGDVFSRDEDPELVRDAVPFALSSMSRCSNRCRATSRC